MTKPTTKSKTIAYLAKDLARLAKQVVILEEKTSEMPNRVADARRATERVAEKQRKTREAKEAHAADIDFLVKTVEADPRLYLTNGSLGRLVGLMNTERPRGKNGHWEAREVQLGLRARGIKFIPNLIFG